MNVKFSLSDGKAHKLSICIDDLVFSDDKVHLPKKIEYFKNGFFSKDTIVPDVLRYNIIIKNGTVIRLDSTTKTINNSQFTDSPIVKKNSIVLVLESPHKKEYDNNKSKLVPIAPAQGISGTNIKNHIVSHLKYAVEKGLLGDGEYPFIIMNPIQWQTSLSFFYTGNLKKNIRNRTWKALWSKSAVKSDFIKRLRSYSPVLVINACTGKNDGSVQNTLHNILMCYLRENLKGCSILSIFHPSRASSFKRTDKYAIFIMPLIH